MIPSGTRIWIVAGVTDLQHGFVGLSTQVQTALEENPFSGQVFVFRGRRRYHQQNHSDKQVEIRGRSRRPDSRHDSLSCRLGCAGCRRSWRPSNHV